MFLYATCPDIWSADTIGSGSITSPHDNFLQGRQVRGKHTGEACTKIKPIAGTHRTGSVIASASSVGNIDLVVQTDAKQISASAERTKEKMQEEKQRGGAGVHLSHGERATAMRMRWCKNKKQFMCARSALLRLLRKIDSTLVGLGSLLRIKYL